MRAKGLADVEKGLGAKRLYPDTAGAPVLGCCSLVPLTGDFSGKLLWGRKLDWTVSSRVGGLAAEWKDTERVVRSGLIYLAFGCMNPVLPSVPGFGSVAGGSEGVTCGTGSYFFSSGLGLSTDSDLYGGTVKLVRTGMKPAGFHWDAKASQTVGFCWEFLRT